MEVDDTVKLKKSGRVGKITKILPGADSRNTKAVVKFDDSTYSAYYLRSLIKIEIANTKDLIELLNEIQGTKPYFQELTRKEIIEYAEEIHSRITEVICSLERTGG